MSPITFYFDFVSTFSYIAIHRIDELALRFGRTVEWRCVSLGHIFQAQGVKAPPEIPTKLKYYGVDFPRSCTMAGLPCRMPPTFPPDVKLARQVFWHLKARDENLGHAFARAISSAVYGRGESVASADDIARACKAEPAVTAAHIAAAADNAAAKAAMIEATNGAIAAGVFGAPFMVLDGEPFWGADRLQALEWRLSRAAASSK
jgi:2-hydroxychromene-2-carboxylate isomerase